MHEVAPVSEKVPATHVVHEVDPIVSWYIPSEHGEQLEEPVTLAYCPTGHCVHELEPEPLYYPARHDKQADEDTDPLSGL